jgi:hypothetical protein
MNLYQKIIAIYPDMAGQMTSLANAPFRLQDDLDGQGFYISEWNDQRPQPTQEQLDFIEQMYNLNPNLFNGGMNE